MLFMKNTVRILSYLGMAVMTAALVACSQAPQPPQTESSDAASQNDTTETSPNSNESWSDILGVASAPEGWQVSLCENPVLLCVEADGTQIGTIERLSYPLSEAQDISDQAATLEFLQDWVEEHYATIEGDRTTADNTLQFSKLVPEEISVGSLPGLRYGFRTTHADDRLFETAIGYVATDGETLYIFTTGVMGNEEAGFFTTETALETFEPHLDQIIQNLVL